MLTNAVYHKPVVSGIVVGYSRLAKVLIWGAPNKLNFMLRNVGMMITDVVPRNGDEGHAN